MPDAKTVLRSVNRQRTPIPFPLRELQPLNAWKQESSETGTRASRSRPATHKLTLIDTVPSCARAVPRCSP